MAQGELVKPEEFGEALYRLFEVERIGTTSERAFSLGFSLGRAAGMREGSIKADALIEAAFMKMHAENERVKADVVARIAEFARRHGLELPDAEPRPSIN